MTKTEIKKQKVKKVIDYLIDEFNIKDVERENQYIDFRYKNNITGSLDTRGFDILLTYDNIFSHEDEDMMQEKINNLLSSL
tara:strand:+ start:437 stop:679 length:243 start_codon:yes stop_codon:yes gene_type:complete